VESPNGQTAAKLGGKTRPGSKHHWRIPINEYGDWKIVLQLQGENSLKIIGDVINIEVPEKVLDFSSLEEDCDNSYIAELTNMIPTTDEIQYVDVTSRYVELNAHWLLINPELKLRRYIYQDTESNLNQGRFIPILLVHGFHSNHTTWNWIVRYLWADGFRNIFAADLYDDRLGVEKNAVKIVEVIDEILSLTNHESLYFIGHSLGGLIGRYIVKKFDPKKIKFLVTQASPHICGLSRLWGKFFILVKNAKITERDVTLRPSSSVTETQKISTEADFYQQTMINICGTKIRGGDGSFKLKDNLVPDMVNLGVNYIHMSVNKNEDTYEILHNVLYGNSIIYKIRLLYITPTSKKPTRSKLYLCIKPKDKEQYQRYPVNDFIELKEIEPYIPEVPVIIFSYLRNNVEKEILEVQIINEKNKVIARNDFIFALGDQKQVVDHFKLDSGNGYSFQFAVYSYRLHYNNST
jgi:hypothetical protein